MTKENKDLLLKDLCARLHYGVMCQVDDGAAGFNDGKLVEIDISKERVRFDVDYYWDAYIDDIKPYLFQLSSMTEEQDKEFALLQTSAGQEGFLYIWNCANMMKWLIENHFDYNGLIEKGLAIDATGKNIY